MTNTEFRQTIQTLYSICENLTDEMQFSLVLPINAIEKLDIKEFDKLGSLLLDVLNEF